MHKVGLALVGAIFVASPAFADPVAAEADARTVAVITAPEAPNVVRAGTEVTLAMREELTTKGKNLKPGRRFQMATAGDVIVNGVIVIPSGTPATGEVVEVRNKGMWGKSGFIGAKVVGMNLNGRHVRLTGSFDDKGVTGTAGVVSSIALVPIAGFFVTGTSALLPMGGQVKGFLDEDIHFRAVAATPTVMDIPTSGATAAPQALRADLPLGVVCETCTK